MADDTKVLQFETDTEYELWLSVVNVSLDGGKDAWVAVQAGDLVVSTLRARAATMLAESKP